MRTALISTVLVVAAATPVLASNGVPHLDTSSLPASCRWTGEAQAKGWPAPQQLAAITSAANCMALAKIDSLAIQPTEAGARTLSAAIAPSIGMLDSVIASNDLESRLIAQQAKADLFSGAAVKLTSAVKPVGTMTGNDLAQFNSHWGRANSIATPFRERGAAAFQELAMMSQTPGARQLANQNPVVASVVTDQRISATQISRR